MKLESVSQMPDLLPSAKLQEPRRIRLLVQCNHSHMDILLKKKKIQGKKKKVLPETRPIQTPFANATNFTNYSRAQKEKRQHLQDVSSFV